MSRHRHQKHFEKAFFQPLKARGAKPGVNIIHHKPILDALNRAQRNWRTPKKGKPLHAHQESLVRQVERAVDSHARHLSIWACLDIFDKTGAKQPYNHDQHYYTACIDDDHGVITAARSLDRIKRLMGVQPPYSDRRVAIKKSRKTFWKPCCGTDIATSEIVRTHHPEFSPHSAHFIAVRACVKGSLAPATLEDVLKDIEEMRVQAGVGNELAPSRHSGKK